MGCCSGIIRVLLFIFNFVFWLIGLALLAIGIFLLVEPASKAIQGVLSFYGIAVYIIIAAGAITTVVGFLGCCGACKESKCLLIMFSVFLGIIFAVEVAAGIVAIVQRGSLSSLITGSFGDILAQGQDLNSVTVEVQIGITAMQAGLQCCGLNATSNWANPSSIPSCSCPAQAPPTGLPGITTSTSGPTTVTASTSSVVMTTSNITSGSGSGSGGTGGGGNPDPNACVGGLYPPCEGKLQTFLEDNFLLVGVAALVFSIVQIFGICFSCIVIKNANDVGPV